MWARAPFIIVRTLSRRAAAFNPRTFQHTIVVLSMEMCYRREA